MPERAALNRAEFGDRYRGAQDRMLEQSERTGKRKGEAPITRKASLNVQPALSRSEQVRERLTSERQTVAPPLPAEKTFEERRAATQPERRTSEAPATRQISVTSTPVFREAGTRGEAEGKQDAGKAFAGGSGGFFIENKSGTHRVTRRGSR